LFWCKTFYCWSFSQLSIILLHWILALQVKAWRFDVGMAAQPWKMNFGQLNL